MHEKLKWNAIGFEQKTRTLFNEISKEKSEEPLENTRNHQKLQGYLDELNHLISNIENIKNNVISNLENIFRVKFKTPELIMIAFSRPSIRNIYEDLYKHFKNRKFKPLQKDDYIELAALGEAANVLALIGDSVLDLGVVQILWDSSLSTVEKLAKKRMKMVSNENLAKICNQWKIYDFRLNRLNDPSEKNTKLKTLQHEKATLVEAIYGVIYLEFGFSELIRTIPFIQ